MSEPVGVRDFRTKATYVAECETCRLSWEKANAHGVAAIHARKTGHYVRVEKTIVYVYNARS